MFQARGVSPAGVTHAGPTPWRPAESDLVEAAQGARVGEELSRSGPAELAHARAGRDTLLRAARSLAAVLPHDPEAGGCTTTGCALARDPGPRRCELVRRLAAVETGPCPSLPYPTALVRFDRAIVDAIDSVRRCRQTEHGVGSCWFADAPGVDGCREILRLAHRLA